MKRELVYYGLKDKEADIYLACLKGVEIGVSDLAKNTGIGRTNIYEILDSLKKKGLVASFIKNKKTYFKAAPPETFLNKLEEKKSVISAMIKDLKKLGEGRGDSVDVSLYEGKVGIRSVAVDMLNYDEILLYGAVSRGDEIMGLYNENFARKRIDGKVILRVVADNNIPDYMTEKNVSKYTKIKKFDFKTNKEVAYFIYGDNVLIILLGSNIAALKISNKLFADSQRELFETFWRLARR